MVDERVFGALAGEEAAEERDGIEFMQAEADARDFEAAVELSSNKILH